LDSDSMYVGYWFDLSYIVLSCMVDRIFYVWCMVV
jgi:hypothetical protein